ncbi:MULTISPECIES: hypothetical protein [unclassified Streptomyces]|uniref:hypothetical protein n=1 Tax=unclassified Streptomyces TaxID=2593676 RepID=UPI002E130651|nr:hypothetical protein OG452_05510 [Streptomyces sp. NBC_01197]WSS52476.1 hypothetical protein OG708_29895 [Streptomyces sp. NBC_01180]
MGEGAGEGAGTGAGRGAGERATSAVVRCPVCLEEHAYLATVLPCACGAPLAPPLLTDTPPVPITRRSWSDEWVAVRCAACGRQSEWPRPEIGCSCGTVLRLAVRPVTTPPAAPDTAAPGTAVPDTAAEDAAAPRAAAAPRPVFRPMAIRTAGDVVSAAARYLEWLGFRGIVQPERRPASGIDLHGPGLIATVEATTRPAVLRDIECLWLHGMSSASACVFFSLSGYTADARTRADDLAVPLFALDLTGAPQPVNRPADELVSTGAAQT